MIEKVEATFVARHHPSDLSELSGMKWNATTFCCRNGSPK
jgi:hypothetical protein